MNTFRLYLAGPLFSLSERDFNESLVNVLRLQCPKLDFILPQQYAQKLGEQPGFVEKMFAYCIHSIADADALLCVLDGPDVDSGTCIEMGYAYACRKPIIGLRTDSRSSEDKGVNLMVSKVCREMIWLPGSFVTIEQVAEELIAAINRILGQ